MTSTPLMQNEKLCKDDGANEVNEQSCVNQKDGIVINVDNQTTIAISNNLVFHGKTKHINIKYYFLIEVQCSKEVVLIHSKTEDQLAEILTKALLKGRFEDLR